KQPPAPMGRAASGSSSGSVRRSASVSEPAGAGTPARPRTASDGSFPAGAAAATAPAAAPRAAPTAKAQTLEAKRRKAEEKKRQAEERERERRKALAAAAVEQHGLDGAGEKTSVDLQGLSAHTVYEAPPAPDFIADDDDDDDDDDLVP